MRQNENPNNIKTMFSYLFSGNETDFTKAMFAQKDTNDEGVDADGNQLSATIRIAKAQKRLAIQEKISSVRKHPGWLILEELLYDMCRATDNQWADCVVDGNSKELLAQAVTRKGVLFVIGMIDASDASIQHERKLIDDLVLQEEADPRPEHEGADLPQNDGDLNK